MTGAELSDISLSTVLEHVTSAVLVVRADRTVAWVNEAAAALAATTPAALIGHRYDAERWRTRDRAGNRLHTNEYPSGRALAGETVRGVEVTIDGADGTEVVLLVNAEPVRDGDRIPFAVVTMQDITAVVAAEDDLRRSRGRLAAIVDHAAEGIVLADDSGTYVGANPAAAAMLGYDRDAFVGLRFADVSVDATDHEAELQAFIHEGTSAAQVRLRRADGSLIEVEAQSVANVEPGIHLSIWRDVTDRNRMTTALAASQRRLQAIVDGTSVGLVLVDPERGVTYANPEAVRLLGREVVGEQATEALSPALGDTLTTTKAYLAAMKAGREDLLVTHRDGRRIRLVVTMLDGAPSEHVVHLEDVTSRIEAEQRLREALEHERKAREEAAELARMKDTFLSAVSHELRTPLTAIEGFAATLETSGDRLDETGRGLLRSRLRSNAERLRHLLDDLLDIDRLRRGASHVDASETNLHKLVSTAARAGIAPHHEVRIDAPDLTVVVDRPKLERIVDNLVGNAVRHTPRGTKVEVHAHVDEGVLTVVVEDSGPGIPADDRDGIFAMFTKGSGDNATAVGTGVGLALVKEFTGLMNGEVELRESALGGAAFVVRVPVTTTT